MGSVQESAIFWDYENCPAPAGWSGCQVVKRIRDLVQPYGPIKLFKAYLSIAEQSQVTTSTTLRSELQASGVSLTDSPHNGRKDVADKMMIVDMLVHAMDNPSPATIIVISGDRDFAYAMSTLRLRQYEIILITLSNAHISLTSQASSYYDWAADVLGVNPTPRGNGNALRGDADGFKFPTFNVPGTPKKAASIPSPKTSPKKSFARSPSPFQQIKQKYSQDGGSDGGSSGSSQFQEITPQIDSEEPAGDMFNHYYGKKARTASVSTTRSSSTPEDQNQDPFLAASRSYPSPRMSSRPDSAPSRPLSRATPARSNLEAPSSPTPSRGSSKPISNPIVFGELPSAEIWAQAFPQINPIRVRATRASFSESSCGSSQYASVQEEPEPLVPPMKLEPRESTPAPAPPPPQVNLEHFKPLIELLQSYHARGIPKPFRPSVAMEIISTNKSVYLALPNVKNFSDYAQLAAKSGIVDIGGEGGEGWISLRKEYLGTTFSP